MTRNYEPITSKAQEQYLKIWTHYAVGRFTLKQLCELFQVTEETVKSAVKWAGSNRLQFPTEVLAESAKEALESRLRTLSTDLTTIKQGTPVNWNAYIGLLRVINDNEKLLWQLQSVLAGSQVTINNIQANVSIGDQSDKANKTLSRLAPEQKKALSCLLEAFDEKRDISIEDVDRHGVIRIAVGPSDIIDAEVIEEPLGIEAGEDISTEDRARGLEI